MEVDIDFITGLDMKDDLFEGDAASLLERLVLFGISCV